MEEEKPCIGRLNRRVFLGVLLAASCIQVVLMILISSQGQLSADAGSIIEAARDTRWFYDTGWREPLMPFLTRLGMLAGMDEGTAIRSVSMIGSVATLMLVMVIAALRSGTGAAVMAAGIICFNPRLLAYSVSGERVILVAGLLLAHSQLLFRTHASRRRTVLLTVTGAALPLLRMETLAVVVGGAVIHAGSQWRDREELRSLGLATMLSLLLFAPYPVAEYVRTGDPFSGSSLHAKFWANCEFIGREGFPASREEFFREPYRGAPIKPAQYILGMHTFPEVAERYVRGYFLLWTKYLPRYAVPHPSLYFVILLGALLLLRTSDGRQEILFVLLAHLPFAFIYPLDAMAPGSGVEARFALHTAPILATWAGAAIGYALEWCATKRGIQ